MWLLRLAAYRELDAGFHQAMALSSLGAGHARLGDLTAAVRYSDEAMAIHARLDDQPAHGESLVLIAKVYRQAGHTDRARSILTRVVEAAGGQTGPVIEEARRLLAELAGSPSAY